jgi:histidinol-phosphate aminotransferase
MEIKQKISNMALAGEIYNLDHFDLAWSNTRLRRLMGNESLYPPSPKVRQAIIDMLDFINYYPEDSSTDVVLRKKLANYVGIGEKAEWIALGNGSMQIIDMIFQTFINTGDEIILPTPDYSPYVKRAPLQGGKVINAIPDENFGYSIESFTEKINSKTKLIFASSPNNPTGQSLSRELIESLCKLDLIVVIDEAYTEFSGNTVCNMIFQYPNLIVSRTFSKAMGLAGIRLGFIVANPEIINYVNRIRTPMNISLLAHTAAIAAIEDRDYIENNVQKAINDRELLYNELAKISNLKVFPSTGNFLLINCKNTGKAATDFSDWLLEAGYIVRSFVNARGLPGNEYFRVTIGTHEDTIGVIKEIQSFLQLV